ncbi:proton-translocating NADH-quinone oxidoreductase, chain N [Roseiflexus castenholzii DSM 13941]|jgi:NADH-quinone oxidoreductase subunit N|uniref:NADH-quinone oxidoreductase subunit N 2 n=2 Tax=Roseiflexus castenholzii TaxID=120962 RepID=NUON2_ROSCS|nr:RecName: Full=NADH-quinone oxidoreductase subunit N 2; AltName: Full=NADH dehydrogenase I subunit N 2; AltName: Full=NDH-1 subunit N 2 [Roseiflexus castenholzii DSM 13941]ABU59432.1 proton-translocating NADH-quinone oxidoreductase, chain N [Roseiflexus castenholzii DSM 13941]
MWNDTQMTEIVIPPVDWRVATQLSIIFGWASVLLVIALFVPRSRTRIVGYLAMVGAMVAAAVGIPLWGVNAETFSGMLRLDSYSLTLNWLFLAAAAITMVLSLDYLPRQGIERSEYYVLVLFATGGMMLLAQGADLIILFLGLELLSIVLYVLTGFAYPRNASEEAGMKYLLIGAFAGGFVVFGIALLYGATGSMNLRAIGETLAQQTLTLEERIYLLAGAALVVVGFGYKVAMAPFHMWAPDVYEGAPTPIAGLLSVGSKAAGFAALLRFLVEALAGEWQIWAPVLAVLAIATLAVGNIGALTQRNVKRMLAYSSIGHAGYILFGVIAAGAPGGIAGQRGVEGVLLYLIAYTFTNLGAFGVLIALEHRGEAAWDMSDLAGLWSRRPWLAVAMAVCMLSLAGVPPTGGFWGKFYVFTAAWLSGMGWITVIGVIVAAIAAFYYLRIVAQMFMAEPAREVPLPMDRALRAGLALATLGVLILGFLPTPAIDLVQRVVLGG